MQFRILGPLQIVVGDRELRLGRSREQRGLAALRLGALSLWRGAALAGTPGGLIEAAAAGLDEQRLAVLEECLSLDLALGRDQEVVAELAGLVAEHPLRERVRGLLMQALYRSGRRAEALEVYRRGRQILVEELGLEPGAELRDLERAILADDPLAPAPGPPPAQLPAGPDHFTGRTGYLAALDALLAERAGRTPVAIVAGAPGVGKTALAVHWAHRVRRYFPGGQLYVNLRGYGSDPPLRPIHALAHFLTALCGPEGQVPSES